MGVLDKLKPTTDRYTGNDYIEAVDNMPEDVIKPIPICLYDDNGRIRMDILRVLLWIIAKREQPDISIEQIGDGICNDNLLDMLEEVFYFWGSRTREQIRADIKTAEVSADEEGEAPINPPLPALEPKKSTPSKSK